VNGGFEGSLAGWTTLDQVGSDGTFTLQSGTASPVNGDTVPAPPGGLTAAMSDAQGPGSHLLFQDFVVPSSVGTILLSFDLFVGNRADRFASPATLDFSTPALNQQARVDLLRVPIDPFTVSAADVLLNVFQTQPGGPLVSGYTHHEIDVTSVLSANPNATLRLRFAEVDNVFTFQLGVDNVSIAAPAVTPPPVQGAPEPHSLGLALIALLALAQLTHIGRVRASALRSRRG
jgi:hypothetical protein